MPVKTVFEFEASSSMRQDEQAGEIVFQSFAVCDNGIVAVCHSKEGQDWHYLSKAKASETGEIAHTVECCRLPRGE